VSGAVAAAAASHVGYAKGAHLPFTQDESVSQIVLGAPVPGAGWSSHAPPSATTVGQVPGNEKTGGPPSTP
jgi:hypothetical protein